MTAAKIEIYPEAGAGDQWRWRYRATNGRIMADSSEGYADRADAVNAALTVLDLQIAEYLKRVGERKLEAGHTAAHVADAVAEMPDTPFRRVGRTVLVHYFFDQRYTGRSHDVELVERAE